MYIHEVKFVMLSDVMEGFDDLSAQVVDEVIPVSYGDGRRVLVPAADLLEWVCDINNNSAKEIAGVDEVVDRLWLLPKGSLVDMEN